MRRLLLLLCCAVPLQAQRLEFIHPPRDCNILGPGWDNPINNSWNPEMPRVAWHAAWGLAAYGAAAGVDRITGHRLPHWVSALIPPAITLLAHAKGLYERRYPVNARDIAFDVVNRSTSFVWAIGASGDTTRSWLGNRWKPIIVEGMLYGATVCYSQP